MKKLKDLKVGDDVWHDGDSSFCHRSITQITKLDVKYDEYSGKEYKVATLVSGQQFDMRTGDAITEPTAYYLTPRQAGQ